MLKIVHNKINKIKATDQIQIRTCTCYNPETYLIY